MPYIKYRNDQLACEVYKVDMFTLIINCCQLLMGQTR